jgi:hypothetical protein
VAIGSGKVEWGKLNILYPRGGEMASEKAGGKVWIVPDCFLPAQSTGDLKSHDMTTMAFPAA